MKTITLPVPDKKRDLRQCPPVDRWWFVTASGKLIRGITHSNFERCFYPGCRDHDEYTMLLRPDDPRPLGRRVFCSHRPEIQKHFTPDYIESMADYYEQYEFNVWVWPSPSPHLPTRYKFRKPLLMLMPSTEERRAS